jgi:CDP-diacylglycerol---glycerol-3-phosphate 3-phosphatidyltransferase
MSDSIESVGRINKANGLTLLRLLLVPVLWFALFQEEGQDDGWRAIAWAVFALAAFTDHLDGQLARRRGLTTDLGAFLDPVADKALIGTALVGLSLLGELWWWVTILILVREIGITLLRLLLLKHGVIAASRGGKAKTLTQGFAIGFYILPLPLWANPYINVLMAVAVVLTVTTGIDYLVKAWRARQISS